MNKFCNEEKNMLENYPEIRDASLCKKPSFLEKTLWKRWHKGVSAVALSIALPTAMICALSACTPTASVDEQQQKAYQNYLSAWEQYETAVSEYNKAENPDKPNLPANLVLTKTLDDKATADNLKSETQKLEAATVNILNLCEIYNNNQDDPAQKVAYQNYLSAWNTYQAAVAEYEALENEEKPALSADLVLSKTLNENSTTEELNSARTTLENATAEINKLIEEYTQQTPTPPEPDKPMTTEEIVAAVTDAISTTLQNVIGIGVEIEEYSALDYKEEDGKYYVYAFVKYNDDRTGIGANGYRLIRIPMKTAMTEENLKNGTFVPTSKYNGTNIIDLPSASQDTRDKQVLAKLNPTLAETNPQFISLTNIAGDVLSIGGTNEIKIFIINDNGISIIKTNARSDGDRTDPIGQSILADSAVIGKDYTKPTIETFEFGKNVLLLGEIFQENDSN